MKQKKSLLQKARENKPSISQERKALSSLSNKNPDLYFRQKQKQIHQDILTAKSKSKSTSKKSTKSTKSTKSKKK